MHRSRVLANFMALCGGRAFALAGNLFWLLSTARLYPSTDVALLAFASLAGSALEAIKGLGLGTLLSRELPGASSSLAACRTRTYLFWTLVSLLVPGAALWWVGPQLRPDALAETKHWTQALFLTFFQSLSTSFLLVLQAQARFRAQALWNSWFVMLQRALPTALAILLFLSFAEFLAISIVLSALSLGPAIWETARWRPFQVPAEKLSEFWPRSRYFYGGGLLRFAATQLDQVAVAAFVRADVLAGYFVLRRIYSLVIVFLEASFDTFIPVLSRRAKECLEAAKRLHGDIREALSFAATFAGCAAAANARWVDPVLVPLFSLCFLAFTIYTAAVVRENILGSPARALRAIAVAAGANLILMPGLAPLAGVHALPVALAVSLSAGAALIDPPTARDLVRALAIIACGIGSCALPYPWANALLPIWALTELRNPALERLTTRSRALAALEGKHA